MGPGRLTLLELDMATAFDLCNPAVVDGPRRLWNRQLSVIGSTILHQGLQGPA